MSIQHTRALLAAVLDGSLAHAKFTPHPVFGLMMPSGVPGIPDDVLDPRSPGPTRRRTTAPRGTSPPASRRTSRPSRKVRARTCGRAPSAPPRDEGARPPPARVEGARTPASVKIATFNINNVNRRLPNLLAWLAQSAPDIACLQELKAADADFPAAALAAAGYNAVWHGQKTWNGVAILARGVEPVLTRRGLPGDDADVQSRYIEAAVQGVLVGCLYLPNGNPQPGPKFDYKLAWFERLITHAAELLATGLPVVLAGDYNVVPTPADIYPSKSYAKSWAKNALLQPESRAAFRRLLDQGWTDAIRACHPEETVFTFWDYFRDAFGRDAGLRLDHLLLSPALASRLVAAGVDRAVRGEPNASDHAPAWVQLGSPKPPPRRKAKP